MKQTSKPWSEKNTDKLLKHWKAGKSASEIAALFGGDMTRNAIIGKVNRLRKKYGTHAVDGGRV